MLRVRSRSELGQTQRSVVSIRTDIRVDRCAGRILVGLVPAVADRLHPVRPNFVHKFFVGELDAGIAVVAGVQRPHNRRGTIADVAEAEGVVGRQGAGGDIEHAGRVGGKRGRAQVERLRGADRVETVPDSRVLLHAARGQRHLHNTVLRGELLPGGRLHVGLSSGVDRGRHAQADHERHRFHMHTAPEPAHDGYYVRRPDGRLDGHLRHVRVLLQHAGHVRQAFELGAFGVHPVQRQRQHAGHGPAAVDDDRRAVPVESQGHYGRSGAVVGLLFHIRDSENITHPDDRTGHGPAHVAVCRCGCRGRLFHSRVLAGDPRQNTTSDREIV